MNTLSTPATDATEIREIAVSKVIPNPEQPRKHFDETKLQQLAESIVIRGLIQPITVRPLGKGKFMIVAGERRWRAHQLAGIPTIRAIVQKMDDTEMALQALVENLNRADMTPLEEARAFQALLDRGWTRAAIAAEAGVEVNLIGTRIGLLKLEPQIAKLVETGQFPVSWAWYIVDLPHHEQVKLVQLYAAGKIKTLATLRGAVKGWEAKNKQGSLLADAPEPSKADREALCRMEKLVADLSKAIADGFKDGECIAVKTVDPGKAEKMADTVAVAIKTLITMEKQLRMAHARGTLV